MVPLVQVVFICTHPAPANAFADFAHVLEKNNIPYRMLATEAAYKTLQDRNIKVENFHTGSVTLSTLSVEQQDALAQTIVKTASVAKCIITDVGSAFAAKVQQAYAKDAPQITRITYYDNPESYVPGGYSEFAARVIAGVQAVLFANANLVDEPIYSRPEVFIDTEGKHLIRLGYSSLPQEAEQIRAQRENKPTALLKRNTFFKAYPIENKGQKIAVYFGGANDVYYKQAFPAFLKMLADSKKELKNTIVLIQQHPRAQAEGNLDGKYLEKWKKDTGMTNVVLSQQDSSSALIIADLVMYYQTSANAKFMLSGIPTFQVGHEVYPDILVKNGLIQSATNANRFKELLDVKAPVDLDAAEIYGLLGIRKNWPEVLVSTVQDADSLQEPVSLSVDETGLRIQN